MDWPRGGRKPSTSMRWQTHPTQDGPGSTSTSTSLPLDSPSRSSQSSSLSSRTTKKPGLCTGLMIGFSKSTAIHLRPFQRSLSRLRIHRKSTLNADGSLHQFLLSHPTSRLLSNNGSCTTSALKICLHTEQHVIVMWAVVILESERPIPGHRIT